MPSFHDRNKPVILVGFQEQDNLGLGYIGSTLLYEGYKVRILDYQQGTDAILDVIRKYDPLVVGFSVIFQYHIFNFRDILSFLRRNGVKAHFSAGGHYPSLRYRDIFDIVPDLDSVVLFEGEYTFLELVRAIYSGEEWKDIMGIACKDKQAVKENRLRPLETVLDNFPIPLRPPLKEYALGKKYATLLAGRGCYYNCAFCSIRQFYERPEGPVKRLRYPELVVEEMKYLYDREDCRIFMFQDDDFPVSRGKDKDWVPVFCDELRKAGLKGKVLWKINCRPDEIHEEVFRMMKEHGLFIVYLGIENGTNEGLKIMNKRTDRETIQAGVDILKKLNIYYDFGFMLFHPWSTLQSISENIDFLAGITGDGSSPVTFCKLLPYAETAIEKQLKTEGRLTGMTGFEDYTFLDQRVDKYFNYASFLFSGWIDSHNGILNTARWARYTSLVLNFFYPDMVTDNRTETLITKTIAHSNHYLLQVLDSLVSGIDNISEDDLIKMKAQLQEKQSGFYDILEQGIIRMNGLFQPEKSLL